MALSPQDIINKISNAQIYFAELFLELVDAELNGKKYSDKKWSKLKCIWHQVSAAEYLVNRGIYNGVTSSLFIGLDGNIGTGNTETAQVDPDFEGSTDIIVIGGGDGQTYLFNNGLTESDGTVKLGGDLIVNTDIDFNSFTLSLSNVPASSGAYDVVVLNQATKALERVVGGFNFIQNQNSSAQTANFWINGTGRFETGILVNGSTSTTPFNISTTSASTVFTGITQNGTGSVQFRVLRGSVFAAISVNSSGNVVYQSNGSDLYLQSDLTTEIKFLRSNVISGGFDALSSFYLKGGDEALKVGTDTGKSDNAYIGFYPRTATPTTRNGSIGYLTAATTTLSLQNSISGGQVDISTTNGAITLSSGTQSIVGTSGIANFVVSNSFIAQEQSTNRFNLNLGLNGLNYRTIVGANSLFTFTRLRGTNASPSSILNLDFLGQIDFSGSYSGSSTIVSSSIIVQATENWSSTASGSSMSFRTTQNGTQLSTPRFVINHDGALTINTTPTTSAGGYDILTRNTVSGVIEKVTSTTSAGGAFILNQSASPQVATAWIGGGGEALKVGTNTGNTSLAYVGFYPDATTPTTRKAFLGFSNDASNFRIVNATAGGNAELSAGSGGVVHLISSTGAVSSYANTVNTFATTTIISDKDNAQANLRTFYMQINTTEFLYSKNGAAPTLNLRRLNGTYSASSAVILNNILGTINFSGNEDGVSNTGIGASFQAVATSNWNTADNGTKLEFYTTPNGTVTQQLRMTIGQDGSLTHTGSRSGTAVNLLGVDSSGKIVDTSSASTLFVPNTAAGTVTDWNTLPSEGLMHGEINASNTPTGVGYFTGINFRTDANASYNTVFGVADSDAQFYVRKEQGGIWGSWRKVWDSGNSNLPTVDWEANGYKTGGGKWVTYGYAGGTSVADYSIYNVDLGSDAIRVKRTNNNVGIGIDPTEKLHVNGNGLFQFNSGDSSLTIQDTASGTSAAKISLVSSGTGASNWFLQTGNTTSGLNGKFRIYDQIAGAERLTILNNGNVGIGTATPLSKLDVTPIIQSNTISIANSAAYIRGNDVGLIIGQGNGPYGTWMQSINTSNTAFDLYINPLGGNVGIGTASPNLTSSGRTVLDINGSSSSLIANSISGVVKGYIYSNGIDYTFNNEGTGLIGFSNGGLTRIAIENGGNVGIGTASPTEKLHVNGVSAYSATTAPIAASGIGKIWAETISSTTEIRVMDSAGNITTISPHNASMIPASEIIDDMSWYYYSERDGKRINVNMYKAIKDLEAVTGNKYIYQD